MASTKISALPGASTLTGAEAIPVVQGGVTKKVTTDQFLTKDASGNVGLGVTPSSWDGLGWMQVANGVISKSSVLYTGANAYYNGGWKYASSGAATLNVEVNGERQWYTAVSGTAGNPISFTQAMTLDASGNLAVGNTTAPARVYARNMSGFSFGAAGATRGVRVEHDSTLTSINGVDNSLTGSYQPLLIGGSELQFGIAGSAVGKFDASGNLLVGTTSTTLGQTGIIMQPAFGGSVANIDICHASESAGGNSYLRFAHNAGIIASVTQNGTTGVNYNTSSDARLKENIAAADNGSALIDGLQVRKFDWKADGSHQRFGFVAQELDAVYPEAVSKPADPDEMMGVDYSKLVPLLVQEIQSLRARVAALETV